MRTNETNEIPDSVPFCGLPASSSSPLPADTAVCQEPRQEVLVTVEVLTPRDGTALVHYSGLCTSACAVESCSRVTASMGMTLKKAPEDGVEAANEEPSSNVPSKKLLLATKEGCATDVAMEIGTRDTARNDGLSRRILWAMLGRKA